jgi:hypothetical protein
MWYEIFILCKTVSFVSILYITGQRLLWLKLISYEKRITTIFQISPYIYTVHTCYRYYTKKARISDDI